MIMQRLEEQGNASDVLNMPYMTVGCRLRAGIVLTSMGEWPPPEG